MIKILILYPWPADPDHFKRHYITRHLPLCRAIPGALRMQYTFEPKTTQGSRQWFCIFEVEYADAAMLETAKATVEARRAAADVVNYSPEPPTVVEYEVNPVYP
jgi:uncharacterized protein (TIGR02118 family)